MTQPAQPNIRAVMVDIAERAGVTFLEALLAYLGVTGAPLDITHVAWGPGLSIAGGAAVLSLIKSGIAAFSNGTPSLTASSAAAAEYGRHADTQEAEDAATEKWIADLKKAKSAPATEPMQRPTPFPRQERASSANRALGRIVRHDPRSLRYLVPETTVVQSVMWERKTPILDQGSLGSCTGNATVGVLGSTPFWDTVKALTSLDEKEAVKVYSLATQLDDVSGTYPPDDTGSSGLGAAQAAKQLGLISGYQHIVSVAAAHTAIQAGPFIVGTDWLTGMDNPDANGVVRATGSVRGGHEYECIGYDAAADLWWFCNSWGPSFGKAGRFAYSSADFAKLLAAQGDGTVFVPITQPAPVPTPTPGAPTVADWLRAHPNVVKWANHVQSLKKQSALTIEAADEIRAAEQ